MVEMFEEIESFDQISDIADFFNQILASFVGLLLLVTDFIELGEQTVYLIDFVRFGDGSGFKIVSFQEGMDLKDGHFMEITFYLLDFLLNYFVFFLQTGCEIIFLVVVLNNAGEHLSEHSY